MECLIDGATIIREAHERPKQSSQTQRGLSSCEHRNRKNCLRPKKATQTIPGFGLGSKEPEKSNQECSTKKATIKG